MSGRRTTNPNLKLPFPTSHFPHSSSPPPPSTITPTPPSTSGASLISQDPPHTPKPLSRPEALWHEMQHKLSEVELSNTAIFFGPSHARALEELRAAQIALAQAWMVDDTGAANTPTTTTESESDVLLARKRRLASDAHFERVAAGVLDVAAKLEGVASATRGAEMESRRIWEDGNDSGESMRT
ncbi:hypothetical protein BDD12DRAFT_817658 [Trichophaea hybrida]|nr:hypothetical protein BDD12DRAFT_817658 [Trichophaea hybrida]